MYVMNISSPERGFAGELRSPGEGVLPSRACEGGGLRGVLAEEASQRCRFQGPPTCSRRHPWPGEAQSGWGSYEPGARILPVPWGSQSFLGVRFWLGAELTISSGARIAQAKVSTENTTA